MRKRKIFLGPCEIAGYYSNLSKGFQENREDCDYITYASHKFGYAGEIKKPYLLRCADFFNSFRGKEEKVVSISRLLALLSVVLQSIWAFFAIFKYDVFIFGFGQSLMKKNVDLKLIKFFGKTIIFNLAHGSEARMPFIDGSYLRDDGTACFNFNELVALHQKKTDAFRRIEKYSDFIIGAASSTAHYASKKFINTLAIGVPFGSATQCGARDKYLASNTECSLTRDIRILHSPSNPAAKGSEKIKLAIQSLKDKGHKIELIMLHGRSHVEVIEEIKKCDFVVDQLYSDAPLAGFATEAAWFGKPAIVGGYNLECIKSLAPEGISPVSMICLPEDIEQAIEYLVLNYHERLKLGLAAQSFVDEQWNSSAVAHRYARLIDDDIPDDWWLDPYSVMYLEGAGQSSTRSRENLCYVVKCFGSDALNLSHNHKLERAFLEFAKVNTQ